MFISQQTKRMFNIFHKLTGKSQWNAYYAKSSMLENKRPHLIED